MRLLVQGLQTGQSVFEIPQRQDHHDAIYAGFALETVTRGFHQNKRIGCAAGRDVLTLATTNALTENALSKRSDDIQGISQRGRYAHLKVDPEEGRPVDIFVVTRMVNVLSQHGLSQDFGRWELTKEELDRTSLQSLYNHVDANFLSDCNSGTKSKRVSYLVDRVEDEQLKEKLQDVRTGMGKDGKVGHGNHRATGRTNEELITSNQKISRYYKSRECCWMRFGKPTAAEANVFPDFSKIVAQPDEDGPAIICTNVVTEFTVRGITEKRSNRATKANRKKTNRVTVEPPPKDVFQNKLWKAIVGMDGSVLKNGVPNETHNLRGSEKVGLGMIWLLTRFDPISEQKIKPGSFQKNGKRG